jgi:phospholipase C
MRLPAIFGAVSAIALLVAGAGAFAEDHDGRDLDGRFGQPRTATPIKHLIVIFQENVSFAIRSPWRDGISATS